MSGIASRRGFTLTEILVAMAIFALGGVAITALFITNIKLSRQAMDYTRASEITRNARSLMTQALSRPIVLSEADTLYQFYFPGTSLTFQPGRYIDEFERAGAGRDAVRDDVGGAYAQNTVFFRLPKQMFSAQTLGKGDSQMITNLPADGLEGNGRPKAGKPDVFRFTPDMLRRSGAREGMDPDDRMSYQFDLQIRRSVQRAGIDEPGGAGRKQPLEDLFVVHIRVYKGYDFDPDVQNDPFFEWDFFVSAAR